MQKVLIIDDDSGIRETLSAYFSSSNRKVETAGDIGSGRAIWNSFKPNIVLLDLSLPDGDGLEFFEEARERDYPGLVVLITGSSDMEKAVKAMRLGAYDYLMKPLDIDQLEALVERAISLGSDSGKTTGGETFEYHPGKIAGKSRVVLELHKTIGLASRSFANVLIRGETGTGKELVAKAIHQNSCPDAPFIAVNCSAIVPTLLESELFGHEKGSFTGAIASKQGQLELAKNGVIFLDEIGDMSLDLQSKLLRVLQEREFKRVGGSSAISLKARIVAATHQNLEKMVEEDKFREDLYYRLKVLEIEIPPLRDRKEDIPILVNVLLNKINSEVHRNVTVVPDKIIRRLENYNWPGNIRELENLLTTGVVRSVGNTLELDVPESVHSEGVKEEAAEWNWNRSMEEVEKQHIQAVLNNVDGHFGKACDILGISRPTLRKKIKDYGLKGSFNDE
jgi:DNA-binding NtrC family response regulator